MSFLETVRITNSNGVFCSFTKFYCFNIQRGFSRPKKEVWLGNSHKIHSQMPSLQKTNNSFANLFYCRDIYARILKQKNFDNELLANSQDHELNRDVQLINKNWIVSIFRGDFLRSKKRCGFETHTEYTANHPLSNNFIIVLQILFIAEIYAHEY